MRTIDERAREELAALNEAAEASAENAANSLIDGAYRDAKGTEFNRNGEVATAHALLAIEARLSMATRFLLWAMEDEDATD